MIIGAGPTGLGAAYRFFEHNNSIAEIIVVEMEQQAGGLGIALIETIKASCGIMVAMWCSLITTISIEF